MFQNTELLLKILKNGIKYSSIIVNCCNVHTDNCCLPILFYFLCTDFYEQINDSISMYKFVGVRDLMYNFNDVFIIFVSCLSFNNFNCAAMQYEHSFQGDCFIRLK